MLHIETEIPPAHVALRWPVRLTCYQDIIFVLGIFCMADQRLHATGHRVKSGNFGHQVNSDIDLVCFIIYFFGIKK